MLEVHNVKINPTTHVLLLKKAIYGLVQAARQWRKKLWLHMTTTRVNQIFCLFIKKAADGELISFVILYVDDGGTIGTPDDIKEVTSALGKVFKVKTMGEMEKFFGCHTIDTIVKDGVWIHQPKLLKNLKESLKNILGDTKRIYMTPSAPKTLIVRTKEGDPLVTPERQKQCRMGFGMLQYLVKHSRHDISNSVR
jgi:Reverse transcriptase (RNA-dependent DNA polymerase)